MITYKSLLKKRWTSESDLEVFHNQRIKDIERQVDITYNRLMSEANEKIRIRYEKKKERTLRKRLKTEELSYKTSLQALKKWDITKLKTKRPRTLAKWKNETFKVFQSRRKLSLCDKDGMLWAVDIQKRVHYKTIQAWHYYWKKNHPNLVFEPLNVRPITQNTNWQQLDQEWLYRKPELIKTIWIDMFGHLEALSKIKDNIIRDINYYKPIYEKYKELEKQEKQRLWVK